MPTPSRVPSEQHHFAADIDALASAIETRPEPIVDRVPKPIGHRTVYWCLGGLCALMIGGIETWILTRDEATAAPAPPPAVVAVLDQDPCAQRLETVLRAVDAYAAAHGALPPSLDALPAAAPPGAAAAPASGPVLRYERDGDGVAISCANPAAGG
jgi:hypothetical protein